MPKKKSPASKKKTSKKSAKKTSKKSTAKKKAAKKKVTKKKATTRKTAKKTTKKKTAKKSPSRKTAKKKATKSAGDGPEVAIAPKRRRRRKSRRALELKPGMILVRQVRSGIGHANKYRRILRALGLKHHQDEVVVADTPSMRGMIKKVQHLISVTTSEA